MKKQTTKKQTKEKGQWKKGVALAASMLIGGACGYSMMKYVDTTLGAQGSPGEKLFYLAAFCVLVYAGALAQVIVHEAGHWVFGLLSGYRFSSFRIFRWMIVKERGKIRFRQLSLAGTGGQCLMIPPEMKDGRLPVTLYNLGGSLMNILVAGLLFALHFCCGDTPILSLALLVLAAIGLVMALMNGIPLHMSMTDNDGYNALSLKKNEKALRAFYIQMNVNAAIAAGMRLREMPEEWFAFAEDADMKNSMIATVGVLACNRLMDEHRFEQAQERMTHLSRIDSGMEGIHRGILTCDRMYCEMMHENRREAVEGLLTREQQKMMQAMKGIPSVIRTQYAYALLFQRDAQQAKAYREAFERCARRYPYTSEIESERELMALADEKAEKMR